MAFEKKFGRKSNNEEEIPMRARFARLRDEPTPEADEASCQGDESVKWLESALGR
jgi:hypothetical protein